MLLESYIPTLPTSIPLTLLYVVAGIGVVLMIYSQFVEAEHWRDVIRLVGSVALLFYAVYIRDSIFILVSLGITIASLIELIEIKTGHHVHNKHHVETYTNVGKEKEKPHN